MFAGWTYIFPTFDNFLERFGGPDLRYVMVTSGTHADAFPINLRTQAPVGQYGENCPLSLAGLVLANAGSKRLDSPLKISVSDLSMPIAELVVETHTIPLYELLLCSGTGLFKPEDQKGERRFCFQVHTFPPKGAISLFIVSAQDGGPLFRHDKIFIRTKEHPEAAKRVQINQLFAETRNTNTYKIVFLLGISLFLIYVIRRVRHG